MTTGHLNKGQQLTSEAIIFWKGGGGEEKRKKILR
jgi:hypothetical protein